MLRVLFYGSCWTTNIGNAFVNLGAMNALRQALGDRGQVYHFGGMSSYLFSVKGEVTNSLDISKLAQFDYVVTAGMTQCVEHCVAANRLNQQFAANGAKLVILGGGAGDYTSEEVGAVRARLRDLPIHAFVSRDTYTYGHYKGLAPHHFDGVDCAFFAGDNFEPLPLTGKPYNVLCLDKHAEPILINTASDGHPAEPHVEKHSRSLRTLLGRAVRPWRKPMSALSLPPAPIQHLDMEGRKVLRTHHTTWSEALWPEYFARPNTMISDLPSDYLSIYAKAEAVYSDRVHACIPALSFGKKAMLMSPSEPRQRMFQRVGVPEISHELVAVDSAFLDGEKTKEVEFLRSVLL